MVLVCRLILQFLKENYQLVLLSMCSQINYILVPRYYHQKLAQCSINHWMIAIIEFRVIDSASWPSKYVFIMRFDQQTWLPAWEPTHIIPYNNCTHARACKLSTPPIPPLSTSPLPVAIHLPQHCSHRILPPNCMPARVVKYCLGLYQ